MDKELKELLEKNLEASEKTLDIVKGIRRDVWFRRLFTLIKWLAVLGILAWGYTQIQPFLEQFMSTLGSIQDFSNEFPKLPF